MGGDETDGIQNCIVHQIFSDVINLADPLFHVCFRIGVETRRRAKQTKNRGSQISIF